MKDKDAAVASERRQRLRDLIEHHSHGNTAEFARERGLGQSLLSRYVKTRGQAAAASSQWERVNQRMEVPLSVRARRSVP